MPPLTLQQAKGALSRILSELDRDDVKLKIAEAREEAGGDVGEILMKVVPIFFEIQGHVMMDLGFEADDDGFKAFAEELQRHESEDPDMVTMKERLKAIMNEASMPDNDEEEDGEEEEEAEGEGGDKE